MIKQIIRTEKFMWHIYYYIYVWPLRKLLLNCNRGNWFVAEYVQSVPIQLSDNLWVLEFDSLGHYQSSGVNYNLITLFFSNIIYHYYYDIIFNSLDWWWPNYIETRFEFVTFVFFKIKFSDFNSLSIDGTTVKLKISY